MRLLTLGRGKTGTLVAEIASERGHSVISLASADNIDAAALTPSYLAGFDAVIDFTTPLAALANLTAALSTGARVVVGTTGWYAHLPALTALTNKHRAALLHGTNFSLGVQAFFRAARILAQSLPGYSFSIRESHHIAKKDTPSGTALTLQQVIRHELSEGSEVPIASTREGDVAGTHILDIRSDADNDVLVLLHDALSRRGFAEGAVQAAEWLADQPSGTYNFADIAADLSRRKSNLLP